MDFGRVRPECAQVKAGFSLPKCKAEPFRQLPLRLCQGCSTQAQSERKIPSSPEGFWGVGQLSVSRDLPSYAAASRESSPQHPSLPGKQRLPRAAAGTGVPLGRSLPPTASPFLRKPGNQR